MGTVSTDAPAVDMAAERARDDTFVPWNPAKPTGPGWVVAENGCHIWTGGRSRGGYGRVRFDGRSQGAHRARYLREVGPIPEGMPLDHFKCDNGPGGCCNPHHCRPASNRENALRGNGAPAWNLAKTHCPRGHPLSGDNLVACRIRQGLRMCRTCRREFCKTASRRSRARRGTRSLPPSWQLTEEQRSEIVRRVGAGEKQRALALEYGVAQATISRTVQRVDEVAAAAHRARERARMRRARVALAAGIRVLP